MVERKLFKTRLCLLYQKGHCPRQTCHFAHGDAELRRFSGSFNGRRDYRDSESRDKFVRRRSPLRRFSPGRDSRGRHSSQGYSPPKLIRRRSDNKRKTKHQFDSQSDDFSESLETSDETEGQVKAKKHKSFDSKDFLDDKLREMQSEIDMLDDRKYELQILLEERVEEADILNSRIKELEMQLHTEKEECKRISSKIKKFIRAHNRHSRLQDELKRSEARLHKLGEKIYSDAIRPDPTEEDASVNIISDAETFEKYVSNPHYELHNKVSPFKKRLLAKEKEESKEGNPTAGERFMSAPTRLEKLSKHRKNGSSNVLRSDKLKGSETGNLLPSTSIAAQAAEEEVIEMEEKVENASFSLPKRVEKKDAAAENARYPFPLPPPPPLPQALKAYLQYEGENENVDVDGDDEESVDVDIV